MARTLNLSGIRVGDSLNISASQSAITAGPVAVSSWGNPNTGGPITITVDRTTLKVAPDSVRFGVDLSASTFDTAGPAGNEIYDARLHDLIYLWDFDDAASGDWTAPENVLPAWKNRNVAKGPWVSHVYNTPRPLSGGTGTGYSASVLVVEPSSGKTATAKVEVFVEDPDVVYAGANTVCINPVGDSDFTGAPIGSTKVSTGRLVNGESPRNLAHPAGPMRWLYKRGGIYEQRLDLNGDAKHIYFGAYGTGDDPIVGAIPGNSATSAPFSWHGVYADPANIPDIRITNLRYRGDYDPVTMQFDTPWPPEGVTQCMIYGVGSVQIVIANSTLEGFRETTLSLQNGADNVTPRFGVHVDNCVITKFGGQYQIACGGATDNENSSVSVTGTRMVVQTGVDDGNMKSPIRVEFATKIHLRGLDSYMTNHFHPHFSVPKTPHRDGALINIHSCAMEGGAAGVSINGNNTQGLARATAVNEIIDGTIFVPNFSGLYGIETASTGVTARNNLVIVPAVTQIWNSMRNFFMIIANVNSADPAIILAAPIRVYNNTFVMERTTTQNDPNGYGGNAQSGYGVPPILYNQSVEGGGEFTNVSESNNIRHLPNIDMPQTVFAPLATDILWTPRNIGRRDPDTLEFDGSLATPVDAIKSYRPATGSAALGAALNEEVSYMDITLQDRPEPPSIGAWEAE